MLTDIIPGRARKYVYGFLGLAAIIVAAIQQSNGDTLEAIAFVLGALGFEGARQNVNE